MTTGAPATVEQHVAGEVGVHELVGPEVAVVEPSLGRAHDRGGVGAGGRRQQGVRRPEDQPLGAGPAVGATGEARRPRPDGRGELGVQHPAGRQRHVEVVARGRAGLVAGRAPAVDHPRPVARGHRQGDPQVAAAAGRVLVEADRQAGQDRVEPLRDLGVAPGRQHQVAGPEAPAGTAGDRLDGVRHREEVEDLGRRWEHGADASRSPCGGFEARAWRPSHLSRRGRSAREQHRRAVAEQALVGGDADPGALDLAAGRPGRAAAR